jgi:hypothetical protein
LIINHNQCVSVDKYNRLTRTDKDEKVKKYKSNLDVTLVFSSKQHFLPVFKAALTSPLPSPRLLLQPSKEDYEWNTWLGERTWARKRKTEK